ncbi:carbon-nitrogen hydrolase [Xylogone sp. PMI_703]|nr:carbon-nitrogen hydrolase [Xylogone sp. PMI_703]
MTKTLKLAAAQVQTVSNPTKALDILKTKVQQAASQGVDLILFPEVFIGGFPRLCQFGAAVGSRSPSGYEQYLQHTKGAVDLGDTPTGQGENWVCRSLPISSSKRYRGDGTRERLEQIAKETGVFLVVGVLEKAGGTLYSSLVYICPRLGTIGKRRKVMPTGMERLIWGQGSPSTLRAVTTTIKGVHLTLAGALCWENWMPLLRQSLYEQKVNLFLAPTAHATEIWASLMQTIGAESKAFVLTAIPRVKANELPEWITEARERGDEVVSKGGTMIVGPVGQVLAGPVWDREDEMLIIDADFEECERGLSDLATSENYIGRDLFQLSVDGLELSPP